MNRVHMLMISSSPCFMQSDNGFDSGKKVLCDNNKNKWVNHLHLKSMLCNTSSSLLTCSSILDLLSLQDQQENDNGNNTNTTKEATMIESR